MALVIAAGIAARLHEVDYNLDGDEVFSTRLASSSFADVVSRSLQDTPHPPLHNLLLHAWITYGFGASEVAVRGLSVLFSAAFLVVCYFLLRRVVAPWLAVAVLGVFAISPFFVYYGQQARPYALIALLATGNLLAYLRVVERPDDRRRLAIWCASSALLIYAQYVAVVTVACEAAVAWHLASSRTQRRVVIACTLAAYAAIVPWAVAAMGGLIGQGQDPVSIPWIQPPTLGLFAWLYVSVFGDVPGVEQRWLLLLPLAAVGLWYAGTLLRRRHVPASHAALFVVAGLVPLLVFLESVWGPKPLFAERQLIGSAVAFVLLLGAALATLPTRVAVAGVALFVTWAAIASPQRYPHNRKPPWKAIAERVDASSGAALVAGQEVWVTNPLRYYRRGPVQLWEELPAHAKARRVLFVCRPPVFCSEIESPELRERRALVATWVFGVDRRDELRLYELAGDGVTLAVASERR